jgi:hypothetical protein
MRHSTACTWWPVGPPLDALPAPSSRTLRAMPTRADPGRRPTLGSTSVLEDCSYGRLITCVWQSGSVR